MSSILIFTRYLFTVDFKLLFNAWFPSSLQTCQIRFQVQKLGVNFATKFASKFQCLNYCKQMFIVQVEINNWMESSWPSGLPSRFVFHWISWLLLFCMNICFHIKFKHWDELAKFVAKFAPNFRTWKRNWQVRNELGNRARWIPSSNRQ
jgi:hypothetical protein